MQQTFREFGHIKGYNAEKTAIILYLIFLGAQIYWWFVVPIYVVKMESGNFSCGHTDQVVFLVFHIWLFIGWPLSYQIMFVALILQLNGVQTWAVKELKDHHETYSFNDEGLEISNTDLFERDLVSINIEEELLDFPQTSRSNTGRIE